MLRGSFRYSILLVFALAACADERSSANSVRSSQNFTIETIGTVHDGSIAAIKDALEHHLPRIAADLRITKMPHFVVKVWSDSSAFRSVFEAEGGSGGVTRGYVNTELMEVRILDGEGVEKVAVHEFAHLATLAVNPTIAANAFWLWESAALYLDGSGPPDTHRLTCISTTGSPSLVELSTPPKATMVYRMGYLIVDYIVAQWGREALVSLIKNNGDIERSLGIKQDEFEQNLHAFLLTNYKFAEAREPMSRKQLLKEFTGNTLTNHEFGQSTFLAANGRFFLGSRGVVQTEGHWSASSENEICLELGTGQPICSTWYQKSTSSFQLESASDCILQPWELTSGDSQGFAKQTTR